MNSQVAGSMTFVTIDPPMSGYITAYDTGLNGEPLKNYMSGYMQFSLMEPVNLLANQHVEYFEETNKHPI